MLRPKEITEPVYMECRRLVYADIFEVLYQSLPAYGQTGRYGPLEPLGKCHFLEFLPVQPVNATLGLSRSTEMS